jgi:dolichol-phosphate mannosyltransferase
MRTLIIIPTYLEAENVADVLRALRASVPEADILVVDDSSPDGTAALAKQTADEEGQIETLVQPEKSGLGVAYRAGFAHGFAGGYEVIVQMDADFSHDPAMLPELLRQVEAGADVVIGSRYVAGGSIRDWPTIRRLLSRGGNLSASTLLGLGIRDATSGFRAYRASVLKVIEAGATRATGYALQVELAYRAHRLGARMVEVPITFNDRVRGVSKLSWHIIGEAMSLVAWWTVRDRLLHMGARPAAAGAATGAPEVRPPRQRAEPRHQQRLDSQVAGEPRQLGELATHVAEPRPAGHRLPSVLGERPAAPHVAPLARQQQLGAYGRGHTHRRERVMDQQAPARRHPGPPAAKVEARRRQAVGAVDVQQVDRSGHVREGVLAETADVGDAIADTRAVEVGEERIVVVRGGRSEARDLLGPPVGAGMGVDGHDLDTGRAAAGDRDRRAAPKAADLDDAPTGRHGRGAFRQPGKLVRAEPPLHPIQDRQ